MNWVSAVMTSVLLSAGLLVAQSDTVSVAKQYNYDSWGTAWDTEYVMRNNLITTAIVPEIAGRIMQYNLGSHAFMFFNTSLKGTTPNAGGQVFGGMRQLASPQSDLPGGTPTSWPPPAVLDEDPYAPSIVLNTPDSCAVSVLSQVENETGFPDFVGLQFKRTVTLYKNSTHVRVAMVMINANNASPRNHGVWDITEVTGGDSASPKTSDTLIWVYVPVTPDSATGKGTGYAQLQGADKTQWVMNAAPGASPSVIGVKYRGVAAKIGVNDSAGWLCIVDRRNGYAFAKRFTHVTGATYPDSGSSAEVYTYASSADICMEVETMGPMTILPNGDSAFYTEEWFAARSFGPIYTVNNAGVVTKPFSQTPVTYSNDSVRVKGAYGVFYPGYSKSIFVNASGSALSTADSVGVTPMDSLVVNNEFRVPPGAVKLILAGYAVNGTFVGNLDSVAVTSTGVIPGGTTRQLMQRDTRIVVRRNGAAMQITTDLNVRYSIEITRLDGRFLALFTGAQPNTFSFPMAGRPAGIYLVKTQTGNARSARKIFIGR